jgi:hypothetical protein
VNFIFEAVRHGARTPEVHGVPGLRDFGVAFSMLTPMGMRQRYLLGRFMQQKVNGSFDISKEVKIASTDYNRTI